MNVSQPMTTVEQREDECTMIVDDQRVSTLWVEGLVQNVRWFSAAELAALPRVSFTETFSCDDKWATQSQRWRGPRLLDVLDLAGLLPAAKHVRIVAGDYIVPVLLTDAVGALLADTLNDEPLTAAHGAPWRLALPGKQCFTSVKWVDRLVVTAEAGENTSLSILRERNRARRAARRETP